MRDKWPVLEFVKYGGFFISLDYFYFSFANGKFGGEVDSADQ